MISAILADIGRGLGSTMLTNKLFSVYFHRGN